MWDDDEEDHDDDYLDDDDMNIAMTDHVITGQAVHCQVCQGGWWATVKIGDKLYGQVALNIVEILETDADWFEKD